MNLTRFIVEAEMGEEEEGDSLRAWHASEP